MSTVRVRGLPQPGRTVVMGVVNVTPDSFSDGGEWFAPDDGHPRTDAELLGRGCRSRRRGRGVHPSGRRAARRRPRSCAGSSRSIEALAAAGRGGQHRHHAGARWPGRPSGPARCLVNDVSGGRADDGDARDGRRARRPVRLHALARALGRHAEPGRLRRRGRRGGRRARRARSSAAAAAGIATRPADHRPGHRLRQDRRAQLGSCCSGSTSWTRSAARSWSGVSRKAFLGPAAGTDGPTAAGRRSGTTPRSRSPRCWPRRSVWGVRVHTVRPHRDACGARVAATARSGTVRAQPADWLRRQPLPVVG